MCTSDGPAATPAVGSERPAMEPSSSAGFTEAGDCKPSATCLGKPYGAGPGGTIGAGSGAGALGVCIVKSCGMAGADAGCIGTAGGLAAATDRS